MHRSKNKKNLLIRLENLGADWLHYAHCMNAYRTGGYDQAEKYVRSLEFRVSSMNRMEVISD